MGFVKKRELKGSEALFGFCGWLTTREEVTIMSSKNDAAGIADLIKLFCDTQRPKLSDPEDGWDKWLRQPPKAILDI